MSEKKGKIEPNANIKGEQKDVEVLFVEDNPDDANLTIRALNKYNLANNLIHLEDGEQALDFIFGEGDFSKHLGAASPKVILLDIKMPKVNGIEVLEKLKSDTRTKKIPVVVLTSSSEDPDVQKCYELGANSYIVKPVDFESFSKAVSDIGFYWLLLNKSSR